jgi:hypothetical protein
MILILSFNISSVSASTNISLPNPGITSASPLYFIKSWSEQISLVLTFSDAKKSRKSLEYSQIKLSEIKKLITENQTDNIQEAVDKYNYYLDYSLNKAQEAKNKGEDIDDLMHHISQTTQKHITVLSEIYHQVPIQAQESIAKAIQNSSFYQEEALKSIYGIKEKEIVDAIIDIRNKYNFEEIKDKLPEKLQDRINQRYHQEIEKSKETIDKVEEKIDEIKNIIDEKSNIDNIQKVDDKINNQIKESKNSINN